MASTLTILKYVYCFQVFGVYVRKKWRSFIYYFSVFCILLLLLSIACTALARYSTFLLSFFQSTKLTHLVERSVVINSSATYLVYDFHSNLSFDTVHDLIFIHWCYRIFARTFFQSFFFTYLIFISQYLQSGCSCCVIGIW